MQVHISSPTESFSTRRLTPEDLGGLQTLFERSEDYFRTATGAPPGPDEAQRAFVAGPPGKPVDDKRIIGVFQDAELVGVIDALTDWPDRGVWMMGMLLLDPAHRGRGLGTQVLDGYESWAAKHGASEFRTALVTHHESGIAFLTARGYRPLSTLENYQAGTAPVQVEFFVKKRNRVTPSS